MSKSFKIALGLVLVSLAAACSQRTEEVVFTDAAPAPIAAEPTYSKY